MRFSRWTTKVTNTQSEHLILIAFAQQQWLRERASMFLTGIFRVLLKCASRRIQWTNFQLLVETTTYIKTVSWIPPSDNRNKIKKNKPSQISWTHIAS
jgi:hypothetical protein